MDDRAEASDPSRVMAAREVDGRLAAMGRAVGVLLGEWEGVERKLAELSELNEGRIKRAQSAGKTFSPFEAEAVLDEVRWKLTLDSAKGYGDAARDFACWWVDAAVAAWRSAALGTPLTHADWAAVTPRTVPFEEEVTPPSRHDDDDEQADRFLELDVLVSPDTGEPEGRRLWGDLWVEHRMPALPAAEEADRLLARTPEPSASRLKNAFAAVAESATARNRIDELEEKEGPWAPAEIAEYDRLDALFDELTHRLAEYARVLTEAVPQVRAANT
ncbi:hypothetical protein IAG44_18945 [Streptomyces roseirectus]|uniref:Uncharacterized protein n=1 Tax=Streptomyces roseirectus TaxID=2768066 RepID=A0A7H0IET7_9ACTN|nr:hypothetical protein [Streptomyces roseirectus]QNP71303.1 hypothetical protein IAG44_18945 [Streptomyces roseirectus]